MAGQAFGAMSAANFYQLRQYLCRFFQDTRIKVSLFLQNGIQGMDGTLALRFDGFTATGGRVPGTVRYLDDDGHVDEEDKFTIASAANSVTAPEGHVLEREQLNAHLGFNMYEADAKSAGGGAAAFSKSTKQLLADAKHTGARGGTANKKLFKATAEDGLNLLANLLGTPGAKDTDGESKPLRINLFPDDALAKPSGDGDDEEDVPTIWIDAASDRKLPVDTLLDDFKGGDDKKTSGDDDLLELMDSTS